MKVRKMTTAECEAKLADLREVRPPTTDPYGKSIAGKSDESTSKHADHLRQQARSSRR